MVGDDVVQWSGAGCERAGRSEISTIKKIEGNGSGGAMLHTEVCVFSYAKVKWEEGSLVFLGVWEMFLDWKMVDLD